MEKMTLKVLVDYSKALLPSNKASKLIYCSKNYIRIRELDAFHFQLFLCLSMLLLGHFLHTVLQVQSDFYYPRYLGVLNYGLKYRG